MKSEPHSLPPVSQKRCARCARAFACHAGDIARCDCRRIPLTEAERSWMRGRYADCLCPDCLQDVKKEASKNTMDTTAATHLRESLHHRINTKTKPPGALGGLEDLAVQIGCIQQTCEPEIRKPHLMVFAADHGIAATGLVNPFPQEVTAQMVRNFLNGGAAVNVFCRLHGLDLWVVDAGVNYRWSEGEAAGLISAKIGMGTRNYLEGPAMTADEVEQGLARGAELVAKAQESGCNTIGFGEMGIGNTSSAALIMGAVLGMDIGDCVGRGTGADGEALATKRRTLEAVAQQHAAVLHPRSDARAILEAVGGYEIAMITGAFLEAAERRMVILVDGFIVTAALLLARQIRPEVVDCCVFAHCSGEKGHARMLEALGARPLLQLGLRLGEGTGAALALPLLRSAVAFLNEMASFQSAGVSGKTEGA